MKTFITVLMSLLLIGLTVPAPPASSSGETATETLTLMRETDGQWRVAGYHIR